MPIPYLVMRLSIFSIGIEITRGVYGSLKVLQILMRCGEAIPIRGSRVIRTKTIFWKQKNLRRRSIATLSKDGKMTYANEYLERPRN